MTSHLSNDLLGFFSCGGICFSAGDFMGLGFFTVVPVLDSCSLNRALLAWAGI